MAHLIYFKEIMGLVYKYLSLGFCKQFTPRHSNLNMLCVIPTVSSISRCQQLFKAS